MTPIDYTKPVNILVDEAIEYYLNTIPFQDDYNGFGKKLSINLTIHQYERQKEVCPKNEMDYWSENGIVKHSINPVYTKIV